MSTALDAWLEGRRVGQFRDGGQLAEFHYDDDAPDTPISLSLPRGSLPTRKAASNFLDNLLPDHSATRERMARTYGARSTSTFDLLAQAGGDVAGGLVLLPAGTEPRFDEPDLSPALERDIADRIAAIKRDPDSWAPHDSSARFSLGGTQGKFTLAQIEDEWFWSNATVPSTHILKPARPDLRGLEAAEAAAMRLANAVGLVAPAAQVLSSLDQSTYIVERFDRNNDKPVAHRLHAEDLAQAAGIPPGSKYRMAASQVLKVLSTVDSEGRLAHEFIDQLAFNVMVGNSDAHAKNYSILLRPSGVELTPMYDVVPVGLYPQFDQGLAMEIGGAKFSQAVEPSHWRKLAERSALDPDEVVARVSEIAEGILENLDTAWVGLDEDQQKLLRAQLQLSAHRFVGR